MYKKLATIANSLTATRFLLIFVFMYLISKTELKLAILTLIVAGITDILDGHLARKLKEVSRYGRNFDSFVDATFLIVTSITLVTYKYVDLLIVFLFIFGGMLRCASYLIKKKITPSKYSKIVIILIYSLMILALVAPQLYQVLKYPVVLYHILISAKDCYKVIKRKNKIDNYKSISLHK